MNHVWHCINCTQITQDSSHLHETESFASKIISTVFMHLFSATGGFARRPPLDLGPEPCWGLPSTKLPFCPYLLLNFWRCQVLLLARTHKCRRQDKYKMALHSSYECSSILYTFILWLYTRMFNIILYTFINTTITTICWIKTQTWTWVSNTRQNIVKPAANWQETQHNIPTDRLSLVIYHR